MVEVGPYRFSDDDVERTLFHGRTLFDLLPGGFPPDPDWAGAPARARAEAVLDDVAPADPAAALDVLWEAWHEAMAALRAAGTYGPRTEGTVVGAFAGDGGVPKAPIEVATIGWDGVEGDRQADRSNHGRPWQALCLWSAEVIDLLVAEGHPVSPGAAGENLCVAGLPWDRVVPGAQLQVGTARCEVSSYAVPCRKNARWFVDGRFDRMHHRHGPVSRVYATVLSPGEVRPGDQAVLEPDAA